MNAYSREQTKVSRETTLNYLMSQTHNITIIMNINTDLYHLTAADSFRR